jgi:hypothetical protein
MSNYNLGESIHHSNQRKLLEYLANRNGSVSRQKLLSSKILDGNYYDYDYVIQSLEKSSKLFMERTDGKATNNSRIILMEQPNE